MTSKRKSQKLAEGAVLKIDISENRRVFARIISSDIGLYNFCIKQDEVLPNLNDIVSKDIFHYCSIYDSIIKKGLFQIIGIIPLTQKEIDKIPPKFHQDIGSCNCKIFWNDGTEREALPEECIGLESAMVCDHDSLIKRIEDYFSGRKNFNIEHSKIILSENDPRYWAVREGKKLKWDFEKREFYVSEYSTI